MTNLFEYLCCECGKKAHRITSPHLSRLKTFFIAWKFVVYEVVNARSTVRDNRTLNDTTGSEPETIDEEVLRKCQKECFKSESGYNRRHITWHRSFQSRKFPLRIKVFLEWSYTKPKSRHSPKRAFIKLLALLHRILPRRPGTSLYSLTSGELGLLKKFSFTICYRDNISSNLECFMHLANAFAFKAKKVIRRELSQLWREQKQNFKKARENLLKTPRSFIKNKFHTLWIKNSQAGPVQSASMLMRRILVQQRGA